MIFHKRKILLIITIIFLFILFILTFLLSKNNKVENLPYKTYHPYEDIFFTEPTSAIPQDVCGEDLPENTTKGKNTFEVIYPAKLREATLRWEEFYDDESKNKHKIVDLFALGIDYFSDPEDSNMLFGKYIISNQDGWYDLKISEKYELLNEYNFSILKELKKNQINVRALTTSFFICNDKTVGGTRWVGHFVINEDGSQQAYLDWKHREDPFWPK